MNAKVASSPRQTTRLIISRNEALNLIIGDAISFLVASTTISLYEWMCSPYSHGMHSVFLVGRTVLLLMNTFPSFLMYNVLTYAIYKFQLERQNFYSHFSPYCWIAYNMACKAKLYTICTIFQRRRCDKCLSKYKGNNLWIHLGSKCDFRLSQRKHCCLLACDTL